MAVMTMSASGGPVHLQAAVAREGHFQESDGQAAVTDVMASGDGALPEQALRGIPGRCQCPRAHVRHLISHLPISASIISAAACPMSVAKMPDPHRIIQGDCCDMVQLQDMRSCNPTNIVGCK